MSVNIQHIIYYVHIYAHSKEYYTLQPDKIIFAQDVNIISSIIYC